jgi:hypothetical protein
MDTKTALQKVAKIDLSAVMWKLKNPLRGAPMSDVALVQGASLYRQWLSLKLVYPEKNIVPNEIIDGFWHAHILDTAKYAEDCNYLFGAFLHHYPYSDWFNAEMHKVEWAQTMELWAKHYSEPLDGCGVCDGNNYCDDRVHTTRPSYIPA